MRETPTQKASVGIRKRLAAAALAATAVVTLVGSTRPACATQLALSNDLADSPGQTVTSLLTVSDVASLSVESLDLQIGYDPAVLTFIAGRNGAGLAGGAFPPTDPVTNDLGGTVLIAGTTLLSGVTPPEGSVLFELDFEIRADAVPGTITAQQLIEVRVNESDIYTSMGGTPNAAPGSVAVTASLPPPTFDMTVVRLNVSGSDLEISWSDPGCVGDLDHQIVYGFGSQYPPAPGGIYTTSGAQCSIGAAPLYNWVGSPDPAGDSSRLLWWLVLATDGTIAEGAWGPDGAGAERTGSGPAGSSGECGIAVKSLTNDCLP